MASLAWKGSLALNRDFGKYADTVQGARVTFLKSAASFHPWGVDILPLDRAILQFGADGGAGFAHGITDDNFVTLIIQTTDFDGRVRLDGVPCEAADLVIFPPGCHFTFFRTAHDKWLAWSVPKDGDFARKVCPPTIRQDAFKTTKHIVRLPGQVKARLVEASNDVLRSLSNCAPVDRPMVARELERSLMDQLAHAWDNRLSLTVLPDRRTISSEQIVLRALEYARTKSESTILIEDIARSAKVEYRTLLRAFDRYLGFSPKHYLMLRQVNSIHHAIRREGGMVAKVADILADHGVTEFGRFAGHYKSLFGELPSETHRRFRTSRPRNSLDGCGSPNGMP
jgi:methylphosphotriester-DNA--protein-cysteine methyltransferase